ncbi:aryl-alcohol dehydrogenase-like predicted oxidoreductase [Ureibacillus xyleni]|uniref:Aryl-alcohol dehydrogenase-like predicted oxidoreductase n=1 Tax=Ureibacillus xyleni TaxID=614648 RepID=A0A285RJ34_9BACL|nr:aldo/keto reductase [Ureibacillus xyleni]SOB94101.1 aryl-alcohol dehydrogenase-like predicted oxidoreductase [Ureibacillus xyleni]
MKKRALGNSSIEITELSLGCMSLPTNIIDAKPIIHSAIDYGINYFDTADLYDKGINEEIVGELLKPHRNELILATKVGNRWNDGENGWRWDPSPSHIENGLKSSLRRLKTDYIDVYQLHGGTIDDPWDDIIETFERLKEQGLIREYGISSIRPNVFTSFLKNSNAISNMMQYNLLDRRAEEWFEQIASSGTSVVTRGSIAKGILTNEWKNRLQSYMSYSSDELQQVLQSLESHYEDIHALALAFNLNHPVVASTVIGARSKEQLNQNVMAYEKAQAITDLSYVDQITKKDVYTEHR